MYNPQLLLIPLLLTSTVVKAYTSLGCYSSLPSSFNSVIEYTYQSSSYCSQQCSGYSYFALSNGNGCYCGNEAPSGDLSSECTSSCFGYNQEMCGGSGVYNFYAVSAAGAAAVSSVNSGTNTATASTNTRSTGATTTSSSTTTGTSKTGTTTGTMTNQDTTSQTTRVTTELQSGTTVVIYSTIDLVPSAVTTVVATATHSSSATSSNLPTGKKSANLIGPVVGGVIGGIVAITLLVVLIFFIRRRGSSSDDDGDETHFDQAGQGLSDSAYAAALKRDNSTLSRPLSNPFLSKEESMIDQRLNPVLLGRRRISEGSLADEADYSRKILRVANPDDEL